MESAETDFSYYTDIDEPDLCTMAYESHLMDLDVLSDHDPFTLRPYVHPKDPKFVLFGANSTSANFDKNACVDFEPFQGYPGRSYESGFP